MKNILLIFLVTVLCFSYTESVYGISPTLIDTGGRPTGLAFNASTDKVYVSSWSNNGSKISVIDGLTDEVIDKIQIEGFTHGMAVNPQSDRVYVATDDHILVVDGSTDKIIDDVKVIKAIKIALNPETNRIYVSEWTYPNGSISVIDGLTDKVIENIRLNDSDPYDIVVNDNTNMIYASIVSASSGPISVISIDGDTDKIVSNIILGYNRGFTLMPAPLKPIGISLDSEKNIIYAGNFYDNRISVINGSNNQIVSNITTSSTPQFVAINPSTNVIYTTNSRLHAVIAIDASTAKIANTFSIPSSGFELTVDPQKNIVYAVNPDSGTISRINAGDLVPEFPFAIPVLIVSITSLIIFYRIKFG
ncbi:MAG: YncE family protein [Thaumarchaeota archaeon]|nr:YncE family protein [Nitrososphaerota archaeon]